MCKHWLMDMWLDSRIVINCNFYWSVDGLFLSQLRCSFPRPAAEMDWSDSSHIHTHWYTEIWLLMHASSLYSCVLYPTIAMSEKCFYRLVFCQISPHATQNYNYLVVRAYCNCYYKHLSIFLFYPSVPGSPVLFCFVLLFFFSVCSRKKELPCRYFLWETRQLIGGLLGLSWPSRTMQESVPVPDWVASGSMYVGRIALLNPRPRPAHAISPS